MTMISDVLRDIQIRNVREEVYKIEAEVDRLLKDIYGVSGIEVISEILKEKFRIDFFRHELNFNELQALIAIFCNEIRIVYDPVVKDYSFEVAYESVLRDNIEIDNKDSYKLKVVGMTEVDGGVTEIDFADVRRDLMWYAVSTKVRSPKQTKKGLFQRLKAHFRR